LGETAIQHLRNQARASRTSADFGPVYERVSTRKEEGKGLSRTPRAKVERRNSIIKFWARGKASWDISGRR